MRFSRTLTVLSVGAVAAVGLTIPTTVAHAAAPLQVTTTSLPSVYTGDKYPTTKLKATGGTSFLGAYKWTIVAGFLPPKIKLSSGGQLSGTAPTILFNTGTSPAGHYRVTVQVKDSKNIVATQDLVLVVMSSQISTTALPNAKKGQLYYHQMKVNGSCLPGVSWKWRDNPGQPLPAGLKISTQGAISGVAKSVGTSTVAIEVTCGGQIPWLTPHDAKVFTLTVA